MDNQYFVAVFTDGMCNYKGKMYQTGEKWVDGCDYECVCRDGNKGDYQCYNRLEQQNLQYSVVLYFLIKYFDVFFLIFDNNETKRKKNKNYEFAWHLS